MVRKGSGRMTNQEARGYIKGKLDCMNECGVFNREDSENTDWCDYCHYCYSQGNFGQQKEAFSMAINALEKQIPKKMNLDYYCGFKSCECPECGYIINLSKKHNYCSNCGQRLE